MVLEDGGISATLGIKQRDPFRQPGCQYRDPNCMVSPEIDCSQQGRVYIVTSNDNGCQEPIGIVTGKKGNEPGGETRLNYIGMTGTSLHARGKSHALNIRYCNQSNALAKHTREIHKDVSPGFQMASIASCRRVLSRYKTEGVMIERQQDNTSLNSKLDGGRGGLVRISAGINRC